MTREHHVAGQRTDWALRANRFNSPIYSEPSRRTPMAMRRLVSVDQVVQIKRRSFVLGGLVTFTVLAVIHAALRVLGGA